jgi:pimeloyl-ACP methyl ester carboxylesterase
MALVNFENIHMPRITSAATALACSLLAGCASLPPSADLPGARIEAGMLSLGRDEVEVAWFRPEAPPIGTLLLQHGFARQCGNLRESALGFAAAGFTVLCLKADMARGNPWLAEALAAHLATRADTMRIVVAGHSAGGLFAARVAAMLARRAPQRLAGVLLFDPVDASGALAPALAAIDGVAPVRAYLAPPAGCNAQGNALPALRAAGAALVAERDATHLDIEGGDTDRMAVAACGEGPPRAAVVARLRADAVAAARAMAAASAPR